MTVQSSRRRFLAGLVTGLVGLLAGLAVGRSARSGGAAPGPRARGPLARAYAALAPDETVPGVLEARLAARLGRPPGRVAPAALARAIREDFAAGATVCVDGWILSRTECRFWLWREIAV